MNKFLLSVSLLTMLLMGCEEGSTSINEGSQIEEVQAKEIEPKLDEASVEVKPESKTNDRIYFLTGGEKEYLVIVDNVVEIQTNTLQNITSLVGEAKSNLELTKDANHLKAIENSYLQLELEYSLLEEMTGKSIVPHIFNDTHAYLSESVRLLLETESYFINGLKTLDNDTFNKGLSYMDESAVYFDNFNTEFKEVMKVYQ